MTEPTSPASATTPAIFTPQVPDPVLARAPESQPPTCPVRPKLTSPSFAELESHRTEYEQLCKRPLQVRRYFSFGNYELVYNNTCSDGAHFSKHGPTYADSPEDAAQCAQSLANLTGYSFIVAAMTEYYPFHIGSYLVWTVSKQK